MKYRKFIISNYKAIKEVEVSVNRSITPIIGINESGKTTILQAILAFDKGKDKLLGKEHINPKNRYKSLSKEDCFITAQLELDSIKEVDKLCEKTKSAVNDKLHLALKEMVEKNELLEISRYLPEKGEGKYFVKNNTIITALDGDVNKTEKLIKTIIELLPNILYFDDFSDRVPEKVIFKKEYIDDIKKSNGKDREWQDLVEEIFVRSDAGCDLVAFLKIEDAKDRKNVLDDVTCYLNDNIVDEWKKLKKKYSNIANEPINIEINLSYEKTDLGYEFAFEVQDEETGKKRHFGIHERSKGFQWFFNFIIKLKCNPKYINNPTNTIYLLDEPGSYLHSSAQTELLKKLNEISKDNTIIYCTHSQYLLDPDIINVSNIKIATKSHAEIELINYTNYRTKKVQGALTPLYDALHLKFGAIGDNGNCLLTEGIIDYYFYKMFVNLNDINIIPGAGAGQLKDMISILISRSNNFLVILDNDKQGRLDNKRYKKYFGEVYEKNSFLYQSKGDFEVEDILSKVDQEKINSKTGCGDTKSSLIKLFFEKSEIDKIKDELDGETRNNINIIQDKITNHFNK